MEMFALMMSQIKNHVSKNDIEPLLSWINDLIPNGLFTSLVVLHLALDSQIHFQLGNGSCHNMILQDC